MGNIEFALFAMRPGHCQHASRSEKPAKVEPAARALCITIYFPNANIHGRAAAENEFNPGTLASDLSAAELQARRAVS